MNSRTYQAFGDELVKIAIMGAIARGFSTAGKGLKSALKESWSGDNASWMGKGKITKHLPIGNKSLTVAGTAAGLPMVAAKEDPLGMERGRAERAADFVGSSAGGMAGMGAGSLLAKKHFGGRYGTLASIGGGLVGGIGSQLALTAPFRAARERRQRMAAQQVAP